MYAYKKFTASAFVHHFIVAMVGFSAALLIAVHTSLAVVISAQHDSNQCSDWW